MELRQYVALLRKWLWLLVLCAVAAGGVAYLVSRSRTPIYQATATLMVNQASSPATVTGYADILTSERLARTYANLLTSRPVLEETAQRLNIPAKNLEGAVTVTPVRDTQLLAISVDNPSPQLAAQAADVLPQVFIERNQEMQLGQVTQSKASLEREIASTEADIARTNAALQAAGDDAQRARLEASLAQYRTTYSTLLSALQQIRIGEAQATNNIVVAEPAVAPVSPIRPRTLTNTLLAAAVGLLAALGVAFLIEYLDDTVKTPDDITRVAGISTLGAIARLKEAEVASQLIAWARIRAPETEAYRTLRTNIQFSSVDRPVRTLLVTSSSPGEGKSTTAANLAVVMAQTGQRIIVVDTDLRRPVLHRVFSVANHVGLTSSLLAGEAIEVDGQLQSTEIENLHVLPSGPIPPNPSELLGSQRMAHLIESLARQADLVIFDSPPVLAVTDAAVMGRQVDGVVLVVDAGRTREQALLATVNELHKTGANLLGAVLNRLDTRRGYSYYYYYYTEEGNGARRRLAARNGGSRLSWPWRHKPA